MKQKDLTTLIQIVIRYPYIAIPLIVIGMAIWLYTTRPVTIEPPSDNWINLYFTDVDQCTVRRGGIPSVIASDIDNATHSVILAAFELELPEVESALYRADERGLDVRVVFDDEYTEHIPAVNARADERSALMHNKFLVVDNRITWVGSMNFTENGAYCNNNNIARIVLREFAENYTTEFEEMWRGEFGVTSTANTPYPVINFDQTRLETYFAAEDGVASRVESLVYSADESIRFMAFSFTHNDIGAAMLSEIVDGVNVSGVFETLGSGTQYSYYDRLQSVADVRKDGNSKIMHHKVIVIDERIVAFGSFNFSANADERNDENLVIVHDADVAMQFLAEFEQIYGKAR